MSKTGGGRGTNQHQIKGVSQAQGPSGGRGPRESLARLDAPIHAATQGHHAVDPLPLPDETALVGLEQFRSKGTERSISRFASRRTNLIFNDMALEGMNFTEPEIAEILEGKPPQTTTDDDEINQILDLSEATDAMISDVRSGTFQLNREASNRYNQIAMRHWTMEPGIILGTGRVVGRPRVNAMGRIFNPPPTGENGENLVRIYDQGVRQIRKQYSHPAAQAVGYSAHAAYSQFYADGNKRTSRLMMNGHLMSHGYDGLVTPVEREVEYNETLAHMYTEADPEPYMNFLLSLYDDH